MIETAAKPNNTIALGYQGENEARRILLTYPSEWTEEFPGGDVMLHIRRAGDGAVYTAADVTDDREHFTLSWTITATETSYAGRGEAQLCYIKDGKIVKSQRYATSVEQSTASVTPTEPPPDELIEQAVSDYIAEHVDVITVDTHGESGQLLQSDGDGTYSWLTVTDPIVDSDSGDTLVPTRTLNRLARAIRAKTGYEGDMTVDTMADVLEQTDMWTTEEYCMNLAPVGDLTIVLPYATSNMLTGRSGISRVLMPYCGAIGASAFSESTISVFEAPMATTIGTNAFYRCAVLSEVRLPSAVSITGNYAFNACTSLRLVSLPSLKYIYSSAFSSCTVMTSVDLPKLERAYNNVDTIDAVFNGCHAIENVELPVYVGIIRSSWFDGCWLLKTVILSKLTQITGNYNFRNCYALEKLYAPECTVWNGTQNFLNCNSLQRMCFYTKPTSISNSLFSGAPVLQDIYVSWAQNEVAGAPWGAPAGCTVHYNTQYDEDGEPIT